MTGPLVLTAHAVRRYYERVRPTLPDLQAAERDARRMVREHGRLADLRPVWHRGALDITATGQPLVWLLVGEDIAFVCTRTDRRLYALTCVYRGYVSPQDREERKARRAQRRSARHRDPGFGRNQIDAATRRAARERDERARARRRKAGEAA